MLKKRMGKKKENILKKEGKRGEEKGQEVELPCSFSTSRTKRTGKKKEADEERGEEDRQALQPYLSPLSFPDRGERKRLMEKKKKRKEDVDARPAV